MVRDGSTRLSDSRTERRLRKQQAWPTFSGDAPRREFGYRASVDAVLVFILARPPEGRRQSISARIQEVARRLFDVQLVNGSALVSDFQLTKKLSSLLLPLLFSTKTLYSPGGAVGALKTSNWRTPP